MGRDRAPTGRHRSVSGVGPGPRPLGPDCVLPVTPTLTVGVPTGAGELGTLGKGKTQIWVRQKNLLGVGVQSVPVHLKGTRRGVGVSVRRPVRTSRDLRGVNDTSLLSEFVGVHVPPVTEGVLFVWTAVCEGLASVSQGTRPPYRARDRVRSLPDRRGNT